MTPAMLRSMETSRYISRKIQQIQTARAALFAFSAELGAEYAKDVARAFKDGGIHQCRSVSYDYQMQVAHIPGAYNAYAALRAAAYK